MSTKKHGNDHFWTFFEDGYDPTQTIDIWQSLGAGSEEVMAHATDKYNAQQIVDALIIADNVDDDVDNKLTKKEVVFLDFVASNCGEPSATMARNAIMWNDRAVYTELKAKFNEIY